MVLKLELRPYQKSIGDLARKENIICCLPTGSGKTLIAIYLMTTEEISYQVHRQGKKIIFVVNTVQLANQQAKNIEDQSGLRTICVTGGSSTNEWSSRLKYCHVAVLTSQLCHDKLAHGFLKFEDVALFVFDECHHVSKSHPMKKIMELYKAYETSGPSSTVPRILGLTASIVKTAKSGSITTTVVAENIAIIEKRLCARAVSYHDYEELLKYSTQPDLVLVEYSTEEKLFWGNLLEGFTKVKGIISSRILYQERTIDRLLNEANARSLPHFSFNNLFTSNDTQNFYKDLTNTIEDFEEIYKSLGPWAAQSLSESRINWLDSHFMGLDEKQMAVVNAVRTQYFMFKAKVINVSVKDDRDHSRRKRPLEDLVSHKANLLLQNLEAYRNKQGTDDELLGLIFCKRRSCAVALNSLIQKFREEDPDRYGFISSEIVTGTNNIRRESLETRVTPSKQKETLQKFRDHRLNLIICTTVLEEGIDVPECNLVVRFDELEAYTSYIQSMGRARKKGGQYCVFVSKERYIECQCNISKFMCQHQKTKDVLMHELNSYTILMDEPEEDDDDREVEDFAPYGVNGPKITSSSAIQLVNRFCQRPTNGDRQLKVFAWYATETPKASFSKKKYRGFVWISDNQYINGYVEGTLTSSLVNAKKAAYLKVCEKLYNAGALDDHLFPK